jgi:hypothetical protein
MISLKKGEDKITPSLKSKILQLDKVPGQAFTFFRAHTPIKTGNARSKTVLKQDVIKASYPYAKPLNDGISRQAPDGMTKPTEAFVKKSTDKIMKRK